MPDPVPPGALVAPAVSRNRGPILDVLRAHLPDTALVLEVAAGSGEHAVHFASALPRLRWLPSDAGRDALASIAAWRTHAGPPNLLAPVELDAADPASWPVERVDAVVCINMVHISPWAATEGLMAGAGRVLPAGGALVLYGAFLEAGIDTAPGNLAFDADLKGRNVDWGLRHVDDVGALGRRAGLTLAARLAMPANNLSLVYRKTGLHPTDRTRG